MTRTSLNKPNSDRPLAAGHRNLYSRMLALLSRTGNTGLQTVLFFAVGAGIVTLLLIPVLNNSGQSIPYAQTIGLGFAYLISAAGLGILWGYSGQMSLGQAGFFAIGAYGTAVGLEAGLPWVVAIVLALMVSAGAAVLLAFASLRLEGPFVAIVTLIFTAIVARVLNDTGSLGQDSGFPNVKSHGHSMAEELSFFGVELPRPYLPGVIPTGLFAVGLIAVVSLWLCKNLDYSPARRAMDSVRHGDVVASHLGVNVLKTKITAFVFSGVLGALGGAAYLMVFGHLQPEVFVLALSLDFMIIVLVGGARTLIGPILGVIFLLLLDSESTTSWFIDFQQTWISDKWFIGPLGLSALVLILVMKVMPRGLAGGLMSLAARAGISLPKVSRSGVDEDPADFSVPSTARSALEVSGAGISFGGVKAVEGVDLTVVPGSIHALVGPNGSGKTTLLNLITGIYQKDSGTVRLADEDITSAKPHAIRHKGISRTFQVPQLFDEQSVIENVLCGVRPRKGQNFAKMLVGAPSVTRDERFAWQVAFAALTMVGLSDVADQPAGKLSYGNRRMVDIARAIAGRPSLIILDEPAAGLNPSEDRELLRVLRTISGMGIAVLLVEHHMDLVAEASDTVTCLSGGRVIFDGAPDAFLLNEEVRTAYLGAPV
jgi:branched-chain amino acid transport system permease protein